MPSQLTLGTQLEKSPMSRGQVLGLTAILTFVVFGLDVFVPLGVAEAVPYVAVVLLALRSPQKHDPLLAALGCSLLTVLGYFLSPAGSQAWVAITNRGIALFAIWATALLAMQIRESDAAVRAQSQMLTGILKYMPTVAFKLDEDGFMRESIGRGLQRLGFSELASVGRNPLEPPPEVMVSLQENRTDDVIAYERHGITEGSPWWFWVCLSPDEVEGRGRIGFAIDITDRKKVERRLATHDAVTAVLSESPSLDQASPNILKAMCRCLGWELGAVWKVDPQRNLLRCVEVWHEDSKDPDLREFATMTKATTFSPGVGLPGRVWEQGKPVWVMDVTKDRNFPRAEVAAKEGLHAAFCFPIFLGDQPVGVMEFFSTHIEEPDESLLAMVATIGRQIGHFIEREHKERRLAASSAVTTVLAEAGSLGQAAHEILEEICEALGWACGAIWQIDEQHQRLVCAEVYHVPSVHLVEFESISKKTTFERGVGLPGRVWESGQPAWIIDVVSDPNFPRAPIAEKEGLHAAFAFPIKLGSRVMGVMEFFHRETQEPDQELLHLFGAIGIQIGLIMQKTGG